MSRQLRTTAAVAVAIAPVASSCGSPAKSRSVSSARYVVRATMWIGSHRIQTRTVGAFDWRRRVGWETETTTGLRGVDYRIVQIENACYERFRGMPRWTRSRAGAGSACDRLAEGNPATFAKTFRAVASSWKRIGRELIRGVPTTHYAGSAHVGAAVGGPFDLWLDEHGVLRRGIFRRSVHSRSVGRLDYYDFGVEVRVKAPKLEAGG
jgi:hypothetical protein